VGTSSRDPGLADLAADPGLAGGINVLEGHVVNQAVAEAHGLPYMPLKELLGP
jgi:alanine dehydrogenase